MGRTALRRAVRGACAAGSCVCLASTALAQVGFDASDRALEREARLRELQEVQLDSRLRANAAIPAGQRLLVDYGAFVTVSYLSLDDAIRDNHVLRQYDLNGFARVNLDGAHEFYLRGRWGYRDFHRGDSFNGLGDEPIDGDIDRGYYRFDLQRFTEAYYGSTSDLELVVQGGRDLAYWANGLVLGQVLDGGIVNVGNSALNLELVAGVTPTRTVDFDTSRPKFDHNTERVFYGGLLSFNLGEHRPFVYGLAQLDHNRADLFQVASIRTDYEYNSYYAGAGSIGSLNDRLRYGVEFAFEFGNNQANSFDITPSGIVGNGQPTEDIRAYAFDVKLDYLFADPNQTRFSAEYIAASGDDDRGTTSNTFDGNTPGTQDNAFNAFGLLNTGLAFSPSVSNMSALRFGVSTFPFVEYEPLRRMQVGGDLFFYMKWDRSAPIDEPTFSGRRFLGIEPDLYVNWQITSDVTLALRYGVFFPDGNAFNIDDARQFFLAGVTFAF